MKLLHIHYGENIRQMTQLSLDKVHEYLEEVDEFNAIQFNMKELTIEALIEEAQIMPMFSERKALIINDAFIFTGTTVKSEVKHNIDLLIEYLNEKTDDTLLLFNVYATSLDKRKKITKIMMSDGEVTEIKPPSESQLKRLIVDELRSENIQIGTRVVDRFIERTGVNYEAVVNELEKLKLYAIDEVFEEDIEDVVSVSLEQNIFKITDLLLNHKNVEAVYLVRQLILNNEEPLKLLAIITRQFRLLYQVSTLRAQGFDEGYIAKRLKSHPYPVKLAMQRVAMYNIGALESIIVKCRDIDYQMKSSYLDKETLFETFILDL